MYDHDVRLVTAEKPIFIYSEATPVDDDIPAPGLYRASVPILKAIADHISMIALYPLDRRYGMNSIHPSLRPLGRALPSAFSWFRPVRKRLLRDDFENGAVAYVAGHWARRSGASHVFSLEGSDPEVLARVEAVANRAGLPFSVYLVDDFAWTMRLHGKSEAEIAATAARMRKILSRARHLFAITDELGALLTEQFGLTATTLRLGFEIKPAPSPPRKDQIFFLGSINFLCVSALKTLIETVRCLRVETGRDIVIRFTCDPQAALGQLPSFVHAAPIPGANALAQEIAASLFAFLPYSFDETLRTMVKTSFPSKSMECLAYARSIVVFAPAYSNSARFFTAAALPTVTLTPAALEQTIRQHLAVPPDHSRQYRDYLDRRHAPAAIRETLLSTLSGMTT